LLAGAYEALAQAVGEVVVAAPGRALPVSFKRSPAALAAREGSQGAGPVAAVVLRTVVAVPAMRVLRELRVTASSRSSTSKGTL
jgi:hypothetical protein